MLKQILQFFCLMFSIFPLKTVELVLIDESKVYDLQHPMHFHGNNFRVLALEKLHMYLTKDEVIQMDLSKTRDTTLHKMVNSPDFTRPLVRRKWSCFSSNSTRSTQDGALI